MFRLEDLGIIGDVQLRIFHYNAIAGQNVTIANIAFNTGFMTAGLIRMQGAEVERPLVDAAINGQTRFSPEFSIDLILSQADVVVGSASMTSVDSAGSAIEASNNLSYSSACTWSIARCLLKLSHALPINPDHHSVKALEFKAIEDSWPNWPCNSRPMRYMKRINS